MREINSYFLFYIFRHLQRFHSCHHESLQTHQRSSRNMSSVRPQFDSRCLHNLRTQTTHLILLATGYGKGIVRHAHHYHSRCDSIIISQISYCWQPSQIRLVRTKTLSTKTTIIRDFHSYHFRIRTKSSHPRSNQFTKIRQIWSSSYDCIKQ